MPAAVRLLNKLPSALPISILLGFAAPIMTPASGQSIAQRAGQVQNGTVRMTFASDPGVCGDGDTMIGRRHGVGEASFMMTRDHHGSTTSFDDGDDNDWQRRCVPGPVRVALTFRAGALTEVHTYVGGAWRGADATDLGRVNAREAADYLIAVAQGARDGETARELLPAAVFADSAPIAPLLQRVAKDRTRDSELRESAVFWLSQTGEPVAVDALQDILRTGDTEDLREKAIFGLSQVHEARAAEMVQAAALNTAFPNDLREKAIFWTGQRHDAASSAFLRTLYGQLTDEDLKDKVIFAMSQEKSEASLSWLLDVARNTREDTEVRRKAIFWAGQSGVALSELSQLYDTVNDDELREHLIFVLSQRHETAAVDKLMDIARRDPRREMRKKALFWLGQSHDARAEKFIRDLITS